MDNRKKGTIGEAFVREYLLKQGFQIVEAKINGCDIVAEKDGKTSKIEVKTTQNLRGGIPDMHDTEFMQVDGQWMFTADYLYVVRIDDEGKPFQMNILSKDEVDRYAASHATVTRIRTTKLDSDLYKRQVGQTIDL